MIIDYQYAYLVGTLIFFIPWLILFSLRKDTRREMLVISLAIGFGMVVTQYIWWTIDWWHPETITGTRVGIEDFLLGFSNGGVVAVIYEFLTRKHLYTVKKYTHRHHWLHSIALIALGGGAIGIAFWIFHIHSYTASLFGMFLFAAAMISFRRDLLPNALLSGLLMVVLSDNHPKSNSKTNN